MFFAMLCDEVVSTHSIFETGNLFRAGTKTRKIIYSIFLTHVAISNDKVNF